MKLTQWISNAFSEGTLLGNPAATVVTPTWPSTEVMQEVAKRNNLPETTFLVRQGRNFGIRWFTPTRETVLAGHATLAAAHVLISERFTQGSSIQFSWEGGVFEVLVNEDMFWMEYPVEEIGEALPLDTDVAVEAANSVRGLQPKQVYLGKDVVVVLKGGSEVRSLSPNLSAIAELPGRGLAVTAPTKSSSDYIARFFCPKYGVDEDPVTGSSHAMLARYWATILEKQSLLAYQASDRGGMVYSMVEPDKTLVGGRVSISTKSEIDLQLDC
jgi:PhzF family phenazine biosynthesis protein